MSTCALLPVDFTAQSLCKVTSATLDPSKHWYLLLKEVCGVPLRKFFIRDVFRIFPNEIQSVAARELQPAKSSFGVVEMDRIPDAVHVVSTFGLVAGLLCDSSLLNSPCCSSTPSSSSSSSCSSIDDTKNRPDLGTINKKRQVLKRCRKITAVLDDVSERYNESIAAVLGNSFLYGTDGEREKVQGIISEVIDLIVTKSKGSRNGLTELLSPQTLTNVFQSMRVPDWVLLFFKLQTRLPDSAWQTLLNLTRLGKSGVSY